MMASNLWVAEVCLPARTLRSVFGLSALVPPPQELVGGLVLARHDRHHHLGLEPHQVGHALHSLPLTLLVRWWLAGTTPPGCAGHGKASQRPNQ